MSRTSETVTENIFRDYYGSSTFIEKSAIPNEFGFKSKKSTNYKGYPDFLIEEEDYIIVVEAKATEQDQAIEEVKHYMVKNNITKDIVGIAVSGQDIENMNVDYFLKTNEYSAISHILKESTLLTLKNIANIYWKIGMEKVFHLKIS